MKSSPTTVDRDAPNVAWSVMNNLIAGILVYGGIGYLIGWALDKPSAGLAIGAVFGLAASTYLIFFRLHQLDSGSQPQQEV